MTFLLRPTRYLRTRLDAAARPWLAILVIVAAAAVGAWIIGFIAGLIVVWLQAR